MNAICPLSQVPVRLEPSHKSEMVSQILFGETYNILEEKGNWLLVSMHLDNYKGWIDRKQSMQVTDEFVGKVRHRSNHVLADKTGEATCRSDGSKILITKGSHLPLYENGMFHLGHKLYSTTSKVKIVHRTFVVSKVSSTALAYLNVPYLWGGRSLTGIDCSGLVQVVYHICGLDLPRDASQQAQRGSAIDFADEAMPGDLAFFDNLAGEIIHVGIIIGPDLILHASGQVRIDKFDHNGIFNTEQGTYTHSLRIIKRL